MSVSYTLQESFAGFRRNRSATLITIFTVSISLLLLGVFAIITLNFSRFVQQIRNRVDIEVFLVPGVSETQRHALESTLRTMPGVADLEFISKEKAAKIFEEDYGESFSDILDDNPLPVSFRLDILEGYNNSDSVSIIAEKIGKMQLVESVYYRKQLLQLIDRRARAFSYAALFIGLVLAVSAVILVANTIRLTIYAKREIIRTMKLVGATTFFVRTPFLIEGALHGLAGGIIASVLLDVFFTFFIQPLAEDLLMQLRINFSFYLFLIICGAVLGLLGSVISIRRFLRDAVAAPA